VTGTTTSPLGIDTTVPTTARMYDFWLGGHDNFAVDRRAALEVSEVAPEAPLMARENRKFLRRAVRYLGAEAGISQFLDIGTGLPTAGNVHQVAQAINRDSRVVCVDNDPMVVAHSRALKTGGNTVVIEADLREPRMILDHPDTRKLIDFKRPLAVLMVAVLHFISDEDQPHAIVSTIRDALPPGSYLVLTHVTGDIRPEVAARSETEYKKVTHGATLRTRQEILGFFTGLEIVEPGLVQVPWRG
jgi:S-adenosyl methyltransferase